MALKGSCLFVPTELSLDYVWRSQASQIFEVISFCKAEQVLAKCATPVLVKNNGDFTWSLSLGMLYLIAYSKEIHSVPRLERGATGAAVSHIFLLQFWKQNLLWVNTVYARVHSLASRSGSIQMSPSLLSQTLLCSKQPEQQYVATLDVPLDVDQEKCPIPLKVAITSHILIMCALKM